MGGSIEPVFVGNCFGAALCNNVAVLLDGRAFSIGIGRIGIAFTRALDVVVAKSIFACGLTWGHTDMSLGRYGIEIRFEDGRGWHGDDNEFGGEDGGVVIKPVFDGVDESDEESALDEGVDGQ